MVGKRYGVDWVPIYYSTERKSTLSWEDLLAASVFPQPSTVYSKPFLFRPSKMECAYSLIVNMPIYLAAMMRELAKRRVDFIRKTIFSADDLEMIDEIYIVNCMGLGATCLGRNDLTPIRGQTAIIDIMNNEHAFGLEESGFYLYPRRNSIAIGGGADFNASYSKYDFTMEHNMIKRLRQAFT
jgi:hypothetical protein